MKKSTILILALLLLLSSCTKSPTSSATQEISSAIQQPIQEKIPEPQNPNLNLEGPFLVTRIIDGDTLVLNTSEKVRLSGINTPETGECYYEEAKQYLNALTFNQEVYLEQDITNKDVYGRLLRYIYINDNLINGIMVEKGYARVYDKYANDTKRYLQLKRIEDPAKTNSLGVWKCPEKTQKCLYMGSKNSDKYYNPDCKIIKRIKPENLVCYNLTSQVKKLTKGDC